MNQCFAVLWIPTINHTSLPFDTPYHNGVITVNISDIPDEQFYIKVVADKRDIDILIQSEENTTRFEHFLRLEFLDFSHNGMVKYRFTPKFLDGSEFGFDETTFPEAIYHMIKSLYHIHDFHEDESDSSLKPFVNSEDIDIHQMDNAALNWYLTEYESIVRNLTKKAQVVVRHAIELGKENRDEEIRKRYESFLQMHVMVLGYDAYVGSLYRSVYNNRYNIDVADKEFRRRAFNIENTIKYFNVLYLFFDAKIRLTNNYTILQKAEHTLRNTEESLTRLETTLVASNENLQISRRNLMTSEINIDETRKSARSSTNWAILSIIISFIIGIGSLWYSIYTSKQSSTELEGVKIDLLNTLNHLEEAQQKIQTAQQGTTHETNN